MPAPAPPIYFDYNATTPVPAMVDLVTAGISSNSFFSYILSAVSTPTFADLKPMVAVSEVEAERRSNADMPESYWLISIGYSSFDRLWGMLRFLPLLSVGLLAQAYFPGTHDNWERRAAGFHPGRLEEAIAWAKAHESKTPKDLRLAHDFSFGRELYGEPLGPFKERGGQTGVILKGGYIVAEWGDPWRVDMTFSVTKSFVSTTVGLAVQDGLIGAVGDPVRRYVTTGEFDGPLNSKITWDHLLRQTSDWEGTLWGKPDWADRPPAGKAIAEYRTRKHAEPGTTYKYNDVRVNLLAYAALQVWRRRRALRVVACRPWGASAGRPGLPRRSWRSW